MQTDVLTALSKVIESRKKADANQSYVASLHAKGLDAVAGKVIEEADETGPSGNKRRCRPSGLCETADLWFHSLVLLSYFNLTHEEVLNELDRRFGVSGLEEKSLRR